MKEITKEEAIKIAESKVWEDWTSHEKVKFQLFEKLLCMPFGVFHKAVEKELGRPVYTHEFGMNKKGLEQEFLGKQDPPTLDEIIALIPEAKRIVIFCEEDIQTNLETVKKICQ